MLIGSISIINVQAESTLKDLNQDGLFMDDMYIDENGTVQGVKTDFAWVKSAVNANEPAPNVLNINVNNFITTP